MGEQTEQAVLEVEFTRRWYGAFLEGLKADGFRFRGFGDALGRGDVVLRHDVDLSLEEAQTTAELEADAGVQATYCILLTSSLYNPLTGEGRRRLERIEALGHDIALHFSTHEYWDSRPSTAEVRSRVAEELSILETVLDEPVETVSFHIPPNWVLGRSFESFRNTYAPAFFDDITYVADSGQRWRSDPPDLRDDDGPVQILTHPGLWGETDADFAGRVEQSIVDACRQSQRIARQEFIQGVSD